MTTLEDRLSRLEAMYEHLATKADLAELKAELKGDIGELHASLVKWMVGLMVGSVVAATGFALLIQKLIG